MIRKNPKEKIKEIVEIFDLESVKNKDKLKNMIKTQKTISAFAKHLPRKVE